jgi:RNA polymerase sigma-70 factor (ECF subfamily)
MASVGKQEARAFPRDQWEILYRRHCADVIAYVRRAFGPGPPDPEDVAHIVISRFVTLDGTERVDNAGAYLRRMARNFVLETHRRDRVGERNLRHLTILNSRSADFTPEDIIVSKQELNRLDAVLARLKPRQRVALLLHRIEGLSFEAIGRELGMSRSGARRLVETAHDACIAAMRRSVR